MIAQFDPDFILHTGDMVEGHRLSKDQFPYWFQNVGSFLHNVPVISQQRQPITVSTLMSMSPRCRIRSGIKSNKTDAT